MIFDARWRHDALRAVAPPLLFGLRLWASVCLALYVAFWLELDNAYWAGTSAAILCQPHLGASLRKGWYRMVGTTVGAVAIVVLTACLPDEALVAAIRKLLAASPFHGEGHRKVWARLRFAGIRISKRRVLRLMREHDLLAPGRVGRPHGPKARDGTIRTERVDDMWGTDLTSTLTGEGQASIFVTVDHASTECVGIHAARRATRFSGSRPGRTLRSLA